MEIIWYNAVYSLSLKKKKRDKTFWIIWYNATHSLS